MIRPLLFAPLLCGALAAPAMAAELDSPFGFTLDIAEGWAQTDAPRPEAPTAHYLVGPQPGTYIWIKVSDKRALDSDEAKALDVFKSSMEPYDPRIIELGGRRWVEIQIDFEKDGAARRELIFTTIANSRLYSFNCGGAATQLDALRGSIDGMVASVAFQAPRPAEIGRLRKSAEPPRTPADEPEALPRKDPEASPEASPAPPVEPTPPVMEGAPTPTEPPEASPDPRPQDPPADPMPGEPEGIDPPVEAPADPPADPPTTGPAPGERATEPPVEGATAVNAIADRYGSQLIVRGSEYDSDLYTARHLTDGREETLWRSEAGARPPHTFIYAVQGRVTITGVEVVNKELASAFPGISAREVIFEGSVEGADGPWERLARVEANANGTTAMPVARRKAQWLRIRILGNHGHPTLTQAAGLRVLTTDKLKDYGEIKRELRDRDALELSIDRLRWSLASNGADAGTSHAPGSRLFLVFKPRGLTLNPRGEYSLSADVALLGADDKVVVERRGIVDHVARMPQAPLSPYVSVRIDVPANFAPGAYRLRLTCRDTLAGRQATQLLDLVVTPPASEAPGDPVPEAPKEEGDADGGG